MGTLIRRLLVSLDRPGIPGWVVFGPNGIPLAWAPCERLARWLQPRVDGHDRARPGEGWL